MCSKFQKIYPILIIMMLYGTVGWAQEPARLSLEQAIEYAYDQSTEVKNARISLLDAQEQIIERRSTGLPQLSAEVSFQRYLQVPKQPLPDAFIQFLEQLNPNGEVEREASFFLKNNFTAALNLDAMIFDGTYFLGLRAARTFRDYTEQELSTVKREVHNAVLDAYLPVLAAQENIDILRKNIQNMEELLYETRELYKEGFAEQLDVDRQQLSVNNLKVELENQERQEEVAVTRLKYTIGFPIDQPLELTEDLEEMVVDIDESKLTEQVNPRARAEFLLAEKGIELNEMNVKVNKAAYLPRLSGFAAYQHSYQGNNFKDGFWAPTTYVGLRLAIPIFDGLYKQSQVERARLGLEEVQNQKRDLERAIKLEVKNARTRYLNARQELVSQRSNLDLAERIYETTQIKYREGVGSSVELTQAEQSLFQAQSKYINALYNVLAAKLDLEMALGQ
jgi:outer membrane protein